MLVLLLSLPTIQETMILSTTICAAMIPITATAFVTFVSIELPAAPIFPRMVISTIVTILIVIVTCGIFLNSGMF